MKLFSLPIRCVLFLTAILLSLIALMGAWTGAKTIKAMPFYDLQPKKIVLRAEFSTLYSSSIEERKENIALAVKSLNNTFVDVNGEFSFNRTVGERTEKRGYKRAKIIVNGEFVDGVGGGVCQVSTTLYNAVLLAGLKIIEYHPHSLPVSYVEPSFDAMVNSGWADLKFINDTHNPVIVKAKADGQKLTVQIFGEPLNVRYERVSAITGVIPQPDAEVVFDEKGEYPDLFEGECRFLRYGRVGYKSEGYIKTYQNGKLIKTEKIRNDKYSATKSLIVYGKAIRKGDLDAEKIKDSLIG